MNILNDRKILVQEIKKTFEGISYPGDNNITYDQSGYHLECIQIANDFKGQHWKKLSLAFLHHNYASLYFFTPHAYQFYIPAYLIASINSYAKADIIPNSVIFSLIFNEKSSDEGRSFEKRIQLLTIEQKLVIKHFLEYMDRFHGKDYLSEGPSTALDSYWNRFTKK